MTADRHDLGAADAAAQLAALQADRAALADRVVQPWWYDALLGALIAGFLASYSLHSTWATAVALVVLVVAMRLMVALYTRLTGLWVNGFRAGPTRRAIRVWVVLYAVVLGAAAVAEYLLDLRGAMAVGGVVIGIGLALISRWWTRIYVAELRSGV
ncbi:hypothetical protein SAMN05660690_1376 [Geodermatophilus telluris]|uniref:Uncharacterized protein n=1 Tax=Geodermatophilus telluris TaxID=1190417 RepID=A0A1G6LGD4_9ACTN|nr:hypothetical protein [Geodermatophilus telluris]SDC42310.1 hypothetical protein SAMN05660690_1376 [Geodermatophilus telluris]